MEGDVFENLKNEDVNTRKCSYLAFLLHLLLDTLLNKNHPKKDFARFPTVV